MSTFKRFITCTIIFAASHTYADTTWNNLQGNAQHTGYVAAKTDPAKIHQIWQQTFNLAANYPNDLPSDWCEYKGMSVVDNTAFMTMNQFFYIAKGSNKLFPAGAVFALDTNTGKIKWQQMLGEQHEALAPLYDHGRVFVIDYNSESSTFTLIAYLADSGKEEYRTSYIGTSIWFGAIMANGNIYSKWDNLDSVNAATGKLNWSKPFSQNLQVFTTIAASDKYIIQNGYKEIAVTDAMTGEPLYQITAANAFYDQPIPKFPVLDTARDTVYQGFRNSDPNSDWGRGIFAFDLTTRQVKWIAKTVITQPTLADSEIYSLGYINDSNQPKYPLQLQAIDADTGMVKWSWPFNDQHHTMSFSNNYLTATDDVVFVPFEEGTVAISRKTHDVVWESSEAGNTVIDRNKFFIVGGQKGIKITGYSMN